MRISYRLHIKTLHTYINKYGLTYIIYHLNSLNIVRKLNKYNNFKHTCKNMIKMVMP